MKTSQIIGLKWLVAALMVLGVVETQAQFATWTGPSSGGEWNTAGSWSTGMVPGVGTNALIGGGTNLSYNLPMSAASFGTLTNNGVLNINTNGFNSGPITMLSPGGIAKLFLNTNAAVSVTGNLAFCSNSVVSLTNGSSLAISGTLIIGCDTNGGNSGTATVGAFGNMTNWGGVLTAGSVNLNPRNASVGTPCRLVICGGTNTFGAYTAQRSPGGNSAPPTLGTDGLVVSNGIVTTTSISIGNNAHGIMYLVGGIVTNTGTFTLRNNTSTRPARFVQVGGLFVDPDPSLVQLNQPGTADTVYSVLGGTNIIGGVQFFGANAYFTNGANIYIGSQGIVSNGTVVLNASLNSGGLFGATAPWTSSATMSLNTGGGFFTFKTADPAGNINNITLANPLVGSGSLNITGGGTLTLGAANTYAGNTFINGGTLALGVSGSVTTPRIFVSSGTIFDVSQVSGFTLSAGQTLSGSGTVNGAVTAASTAVIFPGSNSVTGTLTFNSGVTESGGANNEFNLSSSPTGPGNDFMNVSGGLNLSGTNIVTLNGALASGGAYPLIAYNGNLTGDITNLTVTGASGTFSNSHSASIIYFIAQSSVRGPTNITWIGNPVNNNWDVEITTNWLNTGTGHLDFFVPNDTALFSNLGGSNSQINIPGSVTPSAIIVNTTSNYTFTGNGAIGGLGGITVSNGTLNVLTTNVYTGPTVFAGGTLITPNLANSGSPSGIGQATTDPGSVVFNGGTFAYDGASASTDHGILLTNSGGTIDVTNGTTLTLNGQLVGNGGLTLIDSGTLRLNAANAYTGNTTISNGTLNLNNQNSAGTGAIVFAGGTVDLTASGQPTYPNAVTVTANSTLSSAGGNNNIIGGAWTGNSNMTLAVAINGTGTFSVNGSFTNFLGTVDLGDNSGFFRFNAGGGNTMNGGPNTTFDLGSNNVVFEARNPGTMAVGALFGGTSTAMKGPSSTAGMLIWQIGASPSVSNSLYFGSIQNNAANEVTSISKVGNGTLTLGGQSSYTGSTTINSGTLALTNDPDNGNNGSIAGSTNIIISAGTVLDVSGRTDDMMPLGSSQFLSGTGTINGILDTTGGGTLSPGGGVSGALGTLTVTNNINLGGTTWMKLNRGSSPNSDRLVSSTASVINYGGTLVATNVGTALQVGDTFTLFNATMLNSSFTLALPNYISWDTSQLNVNGSIKVTGFLPPPALTNVDFSQLASGSITLNAVNGAPNGPVTVITSTNLALPLGSWTKVTSTTFDGSGNLNLPITVDPTLPVSFYTLKAQ